MADCSPGDIIRIVAKMSHSGGDVRNVFHAILSGTNDVDDEYLHEQIEEWIDNAYDYIDAHMPTALSFDTVQSYNLTQDREIDEEVWDTLTAGGAAGVQLPPQNAGLCLFGTDTLKSIGRKFLGPLAITVVDSIGTPSTTFLADLASFAATMLAGFDFDTESLAAGNYRPLTDTFIPWVSSQIPDFFATQRRRYYGSGS